MADLCKFQSNLFSTLLHYHALILYLFNIQWYITVYYTYSSDKIKCVDLLHATITESLDCDDSLGLEPRCSNPYVCRHQSWLFISIIRHESILYQLHHI